MSDSLSCLWVDSVHFANFAMLRSSLRGYCSHSFYSISNEVMRKYTRLLLWGGGHQPKGKKFMALLNFW